MDIQIIQILNAIPITQVDVITNLQVPTLDIRGADFSSAEEVHINDTPSPDIVILSKTRILAQIPNLGGENIFKVEVFSSKFTNVDESKILFGLGTHIRTVSGLEQLLQRYLKIVFTTPGTDANNLELGGGLKKQIGTLTDAEGRSISTGVAIAFNIAKNQLIQLQNRDSSIPPRERLLEAIITDSIWSPQNLTLNVKISITNELGSKLSAQVGINNNE